MIINNYFKSYDREDLYQVGTIGVIKAYNNYRSDKNAKFSTYAYQYIYGEIYAYVNGNNLLKIARENYKLYKKINEARNILSQKLMKEPTILELSEFLEIDMIKLNEVFTSMQSIDSLDRVIYDDGKDISLFDTIGDNKDYYDIDYLLLNEELSKLSEKERKLIYLRYYEDRTQSEVANIMGINQVQVSRNEKKTLQRIRESYQKVA